jgi:glycosyltransferase involved in cell wall biosynthesis
VTPADGRWTILCSIFGPSDNATTPRYLSLARAASRVRIDVRFLSKRGIETVQQAEARMTETESQRNKGGIAARSLAELVDGVRIGLNAPRESKLILALPPFVAALAIGSILRMRRLTYSVDVRDIYPEVLAESGVIAAGAIKYRLLERWSNWILNGAVEIICATAEIERTLRIRLDDSGPKLYTVRNGFARCFRPEQGVDSSDIVIAFHGTMGRFQDVELFARVVRETRSRGLPWRYIVIGDGPKGYLFDSLVGPDVEWIKSLPQEMLARRLATATVGLSLRTNDQIARGAVPVRMLEYIGLGVPTLLAPKSEGGNLLLQHGIGRVLETTDEATVVNQLLEMVSPHYQAYVRGRIASVRATFSAEEMWSAFFGVR